MVSVFQVLVATVQLQDFLIIPISDPWLFYIWCPWHTLCTQSYLEHLTCCPSNFWKTAITSEFYSMIRQCFIHLVLDLPDTFLPQSAQLKAWRPRRPSLFSLPTAAHLSRMSIVHFAFPFPVMERSSPGMSLVESLISKRRHLYLLNTHLYLWCLYYTLVRCLFSDINRVSNFSTMLKCWDIGNRKNCIKYDGQIQDDC